MKSPSFTFFYKMANWLFNMCCLHKYKYM